MKNATQILGALLVAAAFTWAGSAHAQCPVSQTDEVAVPTSTTTVDAFYDICSVTSVEIDGDATNYFSGGSFNGHQITLGTALPGGTTEVLITYTGYYDFDYLLETLDDVLGRVLTNPANGENLWTGDMGSTPIYTLVQSSPLFTGVDHDGNAIDDDDHLALVETLLNEDTCNNLPGSTVTNVQNAFALNQMLVDDFEVTLTNVTASTSALGADFDITINSVTTGGTLTDFSVDCSDNLFGAICAIAEPQIVALLTGIEIPSLWGADGLLSSADPTFELYLRDLAAVVMTTGDADSIAQFQILLGRVTASFVEQLLPALLADLKSARIPCFPLGDISAVVIDDLAIEVDVIGTLVIDGNVPAGDVCSALTGFINNFSCTNFDCETALLSSIGDLNGDSGSNLLSYQAGSGNRNAFLGNEWAAYPDPITISPQPTDATILVGSAHTFSADFSRFGGEPYTRQWYSGTQSDGSDLAPIPGADQITLPLPVQNTPGITYYEFRVTDACSNTTASNLVSLDVEAPPVNIDTQPVGGVVFLQDDITLTVSASISTGGLLYQWQKFNGSWQDIGGATNPSLAITNADFPDGGDYRCVVSSDSFVSSATSSTATVTVQVPPIDISAQPIGGGFDELSPVTLTVAASIDLVAPYLGTLTIQWYKDGVPTGVFGDTFSIPSFTLADEGDYFARITSDDFPSGPTQRQRDSEVASLSVNTGVAFRVDPSAPRTGGVEDGSDWEFAFDTIQEAIDAANAAGGGEVWVAGGPGPSFYVYNEVRTETWGAPASVTGSLIMKDDVSVYGGFEGWSGQQETLRSQRSVLNVPTTISGTGTRNGGLNDAYHVVVFGRPNARTLNARLDGFTITGGRATGVSADYHTWRGAGIYNYGSAPVIANCTFTDNIAEVAGGAIANEENPAIAEPGNATIINCVFYNNTATRGPDSEVPPNPVRGGGAVFNNQSNATIQFSTVYGNTIGTPGYTDYGVGSAGFYNWEASPVINSSIFWNNNTGDILTEGGAGDTSAAIVAYSNVQSGAPAGTGNISSDPLFTTFGPTFLLGVGSPSLETADPALTATVTTDLRGVPRPQPSAGAPDMGAFERVAAPTLVCQNQSLTLSPAGTIALNGSQITDPSTDVPATIWKRLVDNGGTPAPELPLDCADVPLSPIAVNLTVIDLAGNTVTCTADVTVLDETDPTAVCQDITVNLDQVTGTYTLTAAELDNGSSDVCSSVTLSIPPTVFDCADAGNVTVVELTATDDSGNAATCLANVSVQDASGPIMNCATSLTVELDANGEGSIDVADVDGGITDACGTVDSIVLSQTDFTCADVGTVNVTVTATDNLGNDDTCVVPVTVEDNLVPVITLNGPSTVSVLINTSYTEQGAVAEDNCDGTQPAIVGGDVVDVSTAGTYVVTYDYIDSSGNAATTVTRTVDVITDPPAVITILGDNPAIVECGVDSYTDAGATATDEDLGDITDDIVTSGLPIDTTTPGTYMVMYEVTDDVGTVTTETRTVEVQDNIAPVIMLIGSATIGLEVGDTFTDPGVSISDACDQSITPVVGGDTVDTNTLGTYVITYDATDAEGNAATQVTRTVVVVSELLEFIGTSPDVEAYIDDPAFDLTATFTGGSNPTTYEWTESTLGTVDSGTVVGNTVSLTVTPGNGAGETPVGTYSYTATVTDDTGDTSATPIGVGIYNRLGVGQDIMDAEITIGDDYAMTFGVTGGIPSLSYQWQVDTESQAKATWVDLADTGNISGTNTDTLSFTGFTEANQGAYRCVVQDSGTESITSSVAVLTASAGVPVSSALGLLGLAALSALGGAAAIRRRKQ